MRELARSLGGGLLVLAAAGLAPLSAQRTTLHEQPVPGSPAPAFRHGQASPQVERASVPNAFALYGFGDGSSGPCPCGNESEPGSGAGCRNSRGWGGRLVASGSASASRQDLDLVADRLVPGQLAFLAVSAVPELPRSLEDGLVVLGDPARVVGVRRVDAFGRAAWRDVLPGGTPPNTVGFLQVFYGDPRGTCGPANLTNGLRVQVQP